MTKRISTGLAALVLLVAGLLTSASPAQATEGTVTASEYVAVQKGWTTKRAHGVFDTVGVEVWRSANGLNATRRYKGALSNVTVYLYAHKRTDGRWYVTGKSWCDNMGCVSG